MFPFTIPWNDTADTITNMRFLNQPILNDVFVGIEDGHFVYSGQRIRFFGGSLSFGANFPEHEVADIIAQRLAKLGCNLVRLHHMEHFFSTDGQGIWEPNPSNHHRKLDPGQMDKLDYLLSQLKENGIFVDLNLHVSRQLTGADGIIDDDHMPDFNKGVDIFDARMRELHKEYAKDILTHVNHYTGLEYFNDPVIAMVEVTNEDSLLVIWSQINSATMEGRIDSLTSPTMHYQNELQALWEAWWQEHVGGDPDPRPSRNDVASRDPERCPELRAQRYIDFLLNLEEKYHLEMCDFLKNLVGPGIGVRVPISGTQWGSLDALLSSSFHDKHRCWGCYSGNGPFFMDSITEDPTRASHNVVPFLSGGRATAKPYVATEVSSPPPNYHAAEPILIAALYGSFQDWDGILPYAYKHYSIWDRDWFGDMVGVYGGSKYDFDRHMTKLVAITVAALIFRRFDISIGGDPLRVVTIGQDVLAEGWHIPQMNFNEVTHAIRYLPGYATLMRRIEIDKGEFGLIPDPPEEPDPPIYLTDTNELEWNLSIPGHEFVKVDTVNVQALIGATEREEPYTFEHGILEGGSITVQDIESTAIIAIVHKNPPTGSNYLIIATGKIENTDMLIHEDQQNPGQWYLDRWGEAPVLVEGIAVYIILCLQAENVEFYSLDPQGQRRTQLPVDDLGEQCGLQLSSSRETLWYELVIT